MNLSPRPKAFLLALVSALFLAPVCFAQDPFGGFQEFVDRGSLKPFTRDLGSVLGAATFHNGRSLGFSGFDVGIRGGVQLSPSKGNQVLKRRGIKAFGLPWVQAEIGLPFRMDGYIRGISFQGVTIAGGGLRYGITKRGDQPWRPQLLVSGSAHSVAHRHFSASHSGANLVTSLGNPIVTTYIAVGLDRTRVVVRAVPALDPTIVGRAETTLESRFTVGASVRPKAYLYLHGAFTLTHGEPGFDTGFGIRF